jgi:hypothetical protein
MQQMFFIADLIVCSTCFRHHYANHQELKSIIQMIAACRIWCFGFQVPSLLPQTLNFLYTLMNRTSMASATLLV